MKKRVLALLLIFCTGIVSAESADPELSDPVIGEEDAKVSVEVWCSFQDPICAKYNQNVVSILKEKYGKDGKVMVLWKDRPLAELHPWANDSAVMMECVYRIGGSEAFWSIQQTLFDNHSEISADNYETLIEEWALTQGIPESSFNSCQNNSDTLHEVEADIAEAQQRGIDGIPTAVINGREVVGPDSLAQVDSLIETELDKKYSDTDENLNQENHSTQGSQNAQNGFIMLIRQILNFIGL